MNLLFMLAWPMEAPLSSEEEYEDAKSKFYVPRH